MSDTNDEAVARPRIPTACHGCGKLLLLENLFVDDGCPCNTPRGVNFTPKCCDICRANNCVKPGHRLDELFGEPRHVDAADTSVGRVEETAKRRHVPQSDVSTIVWGETTEGCLRSGHCGDCGAGWTYASRDERTAIEREHPRHCAGALRGRGEMP